MNSANNTAGPKVVVDTDEAFHTYRIEYDGSGGISLLYDSSQILTGSTFTSLPANGLLRRVFWGELSSFATGTSEWTSFRHDAVAAPAIPTLTPATHLLLAGAIAASFSLALRRRSRRA